MRKLSKTSSILGIASIMMLMVAVASSGSLLALAILTFVSVLLGIPAIIEGKILDDIEYEEKISNELKK